MGLDNGGPEACARWRRWCLMRQWRRTWTALGWAVVDLTGDRLDMRGLAGRFRRIEILQRHGRGPRRHIRRLKRGLQSWRRQSHRYLVFRRAQLLSPSGLCLLVGTSHELEAPRQVGRRNKHDHEAEDCKTEVSACEPPPPGGRILSDVPNTAIIFPTSPAVIEGLRGKTTNVGVKKTLIHRRDHPACVAYQITDPRSMSLPRAILTGTSMAATICLVRWLPTTNSQIHNPANSKSIHATEAGKDTPKCLKRVSTPKHATRITRRPLGTRIQDRKSFAREFHSAWQLLAGPWRQCSTGQGGLETRTDQPARNEGIAKHGDEGHFAHRDCHGLRLFTRNWGLPTGILQYRTGQIILRLPHGCRLLSRLGQEVSCVL